MLTRIRQAREQDSGFTLIELLVVVTIIGILAVIAVPTFLKQREKAWTSAVQSDLRNNAVVLEQWFNENATYASVTTGTTTTSPQLKWSPEVTGSSVSPDATKYCLKATHAKLGSTLAWHISSGGGKIVETTAAAACT